VRGAETDTEREKGGGWRARVERTRAATGEGGGDGHGEGEGQRPAPPSLRAHWLPPYPPSPLLVPPPQSGNPLLADRRQQPPSCVGKREGWGIHRRPHSDDSPGLPSTSPARGRRRTMRALEEGSGDGVLNLREIGMGHCSGGGGVLLNSGRGP
jgi:hypothetical protein